MKLKELISKMDLKVWHLTEGSDPDISSGFCSDMLSHVVGNAKEGQIWLTCQAHRNCIGVASLKDIPVILLVNFSGAPDSEVLKLARQEGISILSSEQNGFELSGLLFQLFSQKGNED